MAEEIDLSASLDESDYSSAKKSRQGFLVKLVVLVAGALALAVAFALGLTGFFAVTTFEKDVTLEEDVTRWTNLDWSYGEDATTITNSYGVWVDKGNEGVFANENGCYIKLIKLPGASGKAVTDREGTNVYSEVFEEKKFDQTQSDFISVAGKSGRLEMAVISYELNGGEPAKAYFRNTVKSGNSYTLVLSCSDLETFKEVSSVPLSELGVSLKD